MANSEHVAILKRGAPSWGQWRKNHPNVQPDLAGADLEATVLREINFSRAILSDANLADAKLNAAEMSGANLAGARLTGATLDNAILTNANLAGTNLSGASLENAELHSARFTGAILVGANFTRARLFGANFYGADLSRAVLFEAGLAGACFTQANLWGVNLSGAQTAGADFREANLHSTVFGALNLESAIGLSTANHYGPSTIGIDTIYLSNGKIPEVFLQGAGVPEGFITYLKSLVVNPIEYYSCFISYSSRDEEFAKRLYKDLHAAQVRCWFAPEDLKIGDEIRPRIDEAIRRYDKLLIVLSENSVGSPWVRKEVETAFGKEIKFETEQNQRRTVLFPIRLDDAVMKTTEAWAADIKRTRHIGNFVEWKNRNSYEKAFARLIRDLEAGDGIE